MQAADRVPSDAALVSSARAGDKHAFAELVVRHQRMLLVLCERSLGDTGLAADAAQEAILQAMLGLDSLRRPAQFGAWLAGIGLNVCRRWLRARAGASFSLDSLLGGQRVGQPVDTLAPDPAWLAEEHELATRIRRVVQALPTGQRKAVVLFYLRGLSHVETAAALGIPVGAVKTRLHKARGTLRRQLWSLWEEMQPMATSQTPQETTSDYVEVHVVDIRRIVPKEPDTLARAVVLLQEAGAQQRILGIWLGPIEGEAILVLLAGVEVPRPLTFTFAINLLEAAGGRLREVRINRLVDKTFWAEAIIQAPDGQERVVDARPSDAIPLALTRNAPIRVAEAVMREASWSPKFEAHLRVDGTHVLGKPATPSGRCAEPVPSARVRSGGRAQPTALPCGACKGPLAPLEAGTWSSAGRRHRVPLVRRAGVCYSLCPTPPTGGADDSAIPTRLLLSLASRSLAPPSAAHRRGARWGARDRGSERDPASAHRPGPKT